MLILCVVWTAILNSNNNVIHNELILTCIQYTATFLKALINNDVYNREIKKKKKIY